MNMFWLYLGLFFSAFTSATILPGTSEAVLAALVWKRPSEWVVAWAVATVGNVSGSLISYAMGRFFPQKLSKKNKGVRWLKRYGASAMLFAWVPFVGDALPIAAGWLRLNVWWCTFCLLIGKSGRYAVVLWLLFAAMP